MDVQTATRESFEQRQRRRWERRKRKTTSPSTTTIMRTLIYTRRTSPHQRAPCSAEWVQGAQTQKGADAQATLERYQRLHSHYRDSTPSGRGSIAGFWERA